MTGSPDSFLLIQQADVLLPDGHIQQTDVQVQGGKITAIGTADATHADRIIDGQGLTLLPGVIDPQVHFREPGLEHKEDLGTATRACARGGVTSFLEMPNTKPTTASQAQLTAKLALAAQKALVNYGFFIGATGHNLDELQQAHPSPGIKIFMGSMQGELLVD
ncbi:MAG: amidohydrolase family protein, partial [Acaryochloridaceae cyanobacterium CSU_3_4]|nr:amidohydrolase family protein [Acaryochloridaceae cyanobacterium CSU_3_4]